MCMDRYGQGSLALQASLPIANHQVRMKLISVNFLNVQDGLHSEVKGGLCDAWPYPVCGVQD